MQAFLEGLAAIGAILGAVGLFLTFTVANGAPQEAAGAAMSIALAVIPYCLAALGQRREMLDRTKKG